MASTITSRLSQSMPLFRGKNILTQQLPQNQVAMDSHMSKRVSRTTRVWIKIIILGFFALSTASFSRPIAATSMPCQPLLTDGGLEEAAEWQMKNSDGLSLLSTQVVRTGHQSAYLGGRHNAADRLSTSVQLPADVEIVTLRFWWQLQSQETVTGNDQLIVLAGTKQNAPLATLLELSGRNVAHEWQPVSIDLSHLAGQVIQLQFLSQTDGEQITDFFLDDVEIVACGETI